MPQRFPMAMSDHEREIALFHLIAQVYLARAKYVQIAQANRALYRALNNLN